MSAFINTPHYRHDQPECLGILLANLGTPNSPSVADVRRYLAEFLWDRRVVEMARLPWWLILHGVILRTRPAHSAEVYQSVWTAEGSPLLVIAQQQAAALQLRLNEKYHSGAIKVALGMRYGKPAIATALTELRQANARRILVFPLYPQYSSSTTAAVFDAVTTELQRWRWLPELRFINNYHDHPAYIQALAASIRRHWDTHGEPERLLFSFHGIPQKYFDLGDPYYCQCQKTARLVIEQLGLAPERWFLAFQSRLGKQEWLRPYTDHTLHEWAAAGIKSVQVLSPGFSADCLETIEEIDAENRQRFLAAGGERYSYIPCLNAAAEHIELLAELVAQHACGWPELTGSMTAAELAQRQTRALARGAEQ
ncbi:ferrochelatase [Chromatium okenii]|uniref:ferrochelatase n=1 Tax=Chromatium okenii TaxID=61644 RepID=UPI001906B885|nr:ferrochelatase [Chromatium okenii]MBK1642240.1 ferrochelatase [Chromatium okenii]